MKVTFLTRPGCHLCDEALRELNGFLAVGPAAASDPQPGQIEVEVVDIESDEGLLRKYMERIPVILLDGEFVSEFVFDPEEFDAALTARARGEA